jgi:hypothetical protein
MQELVEIHDFDDEIDEKAILQNNISLKQCQNFVKAPKSHWKKNSHKQ